jgi:hypothetical protein
MTTGSYSMVELELTRRLNAVESAIEHLSARVSALENHVGKGQSELRIQAAGSGSQVPPPHLQGPSPQAQTDPEAERRRVVESPGDPPTTLASPAAPEPAGGPPAGPPPQAAHPELELQVSKVLLMALDKLDARYGQGRYRLSLRVDGRGALLRLWGDLAAGLSRIESAQPDMIAILAEGPGYQAAVWVKGS